MNPPYRPQLEVADGQRATIRSHLAALLGNDGVLLLPTTPGPAPLLNTPPVSDSDGPATHRRRDRERKETRWPPKAT